LPSATQTVRPNILVPSPASQQQPARQVPPKSFCMIWAERIASHQPYLHSACKKHLIGELLRVCNGGDFNPSDPTTRQRIGMLTMCAAECTFNAINPQRERDCYEKCVGASYDRCLSQVKYIPGCSSFVPGGGGGALGPIGLVDAFCMALCAWAPTPRERAICVLGCAVPVGLAAAACNTAMLACLRSTVIFVRTSAMTIPLARGLRDILRPLGYNDGGVQAEF